MSSSEQVTLDCTYSVSRADCWSYKSLVGTHLIFWWKPYFFQVNRILNFTGCSDWSAADCTGRFDVDKYDLNT